MFYRLISWNVNGLRAVYKKGFFDWFKKENADIVCLQETKAHFEQLPQELTLVQNYNCYYSKPLKKGYSGVAVFSKEKPKSVTNALGISKFDCEGRLLRLDFDNFVLFNVYFPNGKASPERLKFKLEFYDEFLNQITQLTKTGKEIIICGDVNTAHKEIDLAHPKENSNSSGFLPIERAWMDKFINSGFIDTFRIFNQEKNMYTWWDMKSRARQRNVGWRIDYFFISDKLKNNITSAFIEPQTFGSDHCPIGIEIKF
jgi:exodeoxyribonuclease III